MQETAEQIRGTRTTHSKTSEKRQKQQQCGSVHVEGPLCLVRTNASISVARIRYAFFGAYNARADKAIAFFILRMASFKEQH